MQPTAWRMQTWNPWVLDKLGIFHLDVLTAFCRLFHGRPSSLGVSLNLTDFVLKYLWAYLQFVRRVASASCLLNLTPGCWVAAGHPWEMPLGFPPWLWYQGPRPFQGNVLSENGVHAYGC